MDKKGNRITIKRFIRENLAKIKIQGEGKLAVTPGEISREVEKKYEVEMTAKTVRNHLTEIYGKEIDGKPVRVQADGVEILIKDDPYNQVSVDIFPRVKNGKLFPRLENRAFLPRLRKLVEATF